MKINDEFLKVSDHTSKMDGFEVKNNKVYAVLAYFWILFFLPLIICPKSKYGRFHTNQGLILLIVSTCFGIVSGIISAIFNAIHLGFIGGLIGGIGSLFIFIIFLYGIINTINGKSKTLPFIGHITIISAQ